MTGQNKSIDVPELSGTLAAASSCEVAWRLPGQCLEKNGKDVNRVLKHASHGTGGPCSSGLQKGLQGSNWTFSSMVDAGPDRGVHAWEVLCLVHQTLASAVPR